MPPTARRQVSQAAKAEAKTYAQAKRGGRAIQQRKPKRPQPDGL